jgi:hypothetical protein
MIWELELALDNLTQLATMDQSKLLQSLKYIHIGGRSLECGKIIFVRKSTSLFRGKPILEVIYDNPEEYFGVSFFFASLSYIPATLRFKYDTDIQRDNMHCLIEKIILGQLDLQNELLKSKE